MRQGEVFGPFKDRVDFLRQRTVVDRQLTTVTAGAPNFGPTHDCRERAHVPPLLHVVADALLEHLARYEYGRDGLIFTNDYGDPLRRSGFNTTWRRALTKADTEPAVLHSLRHYYMSLQIRHSASVTVVQERLGHASASATLGTYSHLWPDSEDRTREAIDAALGESATRVLADSLRTLSTM
ncbi:tyrosine-type recombinase/integrase [Demequina aurantiaca]|uniref:tyrosine-type recombinase/integrase n=1 Tax=Demequina aurantiaca TaxID=676200 RepID=UPI003D35298E